MTGQDLYDSFTTEELEKLKEEARQKWGHTDAWKQSQQRTKNWIEEDYKRIAKEGKEFTQKLANLMDKGPRDEEVQKMITLHHKGIEVFYDCPLDFYKNLGEMYVQDPRFTAFYEKFRKGMAVFMRDAIAYYCDQNSRVKDEVL